MDQVVLDYFDIRLRKRDVNTLQKGCWLNDQIITFYFEYLQNNISANQESLLFMQVPTAYMLLQMPELIPELSQQLKFQEKQLILIPINDNPDTEVIEGGQHWSLLVFDVQNFNFVHFDSIKGSNQSITQRFSENFANNLNLKTVNNGKFQLDQKNYREFEKMPQQKNGCDCGMFVLMVAEKVGQNQCLENLQLEEINEKSVENKRSQIQELLQQLKENNQETSKNH
eukprot:TRINITY_DN12697_c3_g1_i2.p2 TRINITY_DN12697_c3_g1~~TRINITY_DN12697_c3_g1_i2.p2  ORF type:complete len:227 (-),score=25.93 TRINITY_DN12697_c3_g1_i2:145-825(-)